MHDLNDTFLEKIKSSGIMKQSNKDFEDAVSQNEIEEINSIYTKRKN